MVIMGRTRYVYGAIVALALAVAAPMTQGKGEFLLYDDVHTEGGGSNNSLNVRTKHIDFCGQISLKDVMEGEIEHKWQD